MLEGEDPREALEGFRQVVEMEQEKGEWWVAAAHGEYDPDGLLHIEHRCRLL